MAAYTPRTGARCSCRPGVQRDNCPNCEGSGWVIDFQQIHARRRARELNQAAVKQAVPDAVTRYVVTYVNKDGMRTLVGPAQGRCTRETEAEAVLDLYNLRTNNSADVLRQMYGEDTFEVRPCPCYPGHFDPIGVYFD